MSFRSLVFTLSLASALTASAQSTRKPAAKKPEAAPVTAPAPAAEPARKSPPANPDAALLKAILQAYEPVPEEIRALAVEDLGLLGDARALNVLSDFALDPFPQVQLAAVRAIRSFQQPRAEEILANLVRHPRPSEPVKLAALEGLAFQRTRTAQVLLESIRADDRNGQKIQTYARELIARAAAAPPAQ